VPAFVVGIFAVAGSLALAVPFVLVILVRQSRKVSRQRRAFAAARGWAMEDRRPRQNEVRWSAVAAEGVPWRLVCEYADADGGGHNRAVLEIGRGSAESRYETIPEPAGLLWAAIDTEALAALRTFFAQSWEPATSDGFAMGGLERWLGFAQSWMTGPQLRALIVEKGRASPHGSNGWSFVSRSNVIAPTALSGSVEALANQAGPRSRHRPWVLMGHDTLLVVFFETLDDGAQIERVVDCALRLWNQSRLG
jgi:hypothetical protein